MSSRWNRLNFIFTSSWPTLTADFIKKVLSVYTHSMTTIYLSLSAQVAKSTSFMKFPVCKIVADSYFNNFAMPFGTLWRILFYFRNICKTGISSLI